MRNYQALEIAELSLVGNLPSLPAVALEILRLCQDPDCSIGQLAEPMSLDPVLATRVLQLANSAHYTRGNEITSLRRAAVLLGLRTLKVLALGFMLVNELPRKGGEGSFDFEQYWHRSLVSAVAARSIAVTVRSPLSEEAFVCGLVSQIGKLALAQAAPEGYQEVVERGDGWPTDLLEFEVLGFTSSDVSEQLIKRWGLPQSIVMAVSYSGRLDALPLDATRETFDLANLTALAVRAGSVLFEAESAAHLAGLRNEAARVYGLSEEQIEGVLDTLEEGVLESAAMFSVELPPSQTYDETLAQARAELIAVSLSNIVDLEQRMQAHAALAVENFALRARALTDSVTGLPNRAAFDDALQSKIELRRRNPAEAGALGLIMIDVDALKTLNDTYGHQVGDIALQTVAREMAGVIRGSDLLARYGGDEFCLLLHETSREDILAAGERLRRAVENTSLTLPSGIDVHLTISVGATITTESELGTGKELIESVDRALYRAKTDGRNRVVTTRETAEASSL